MAASAASCSHCGKREVSFKKCGRCKQASYCGAECQKAAWKAGHKTICLALQEVMELICVAMESADWRGVLKWENRIDELIATKSDVQVEAFLDSFSSARKMMYAETGDGEHCLVAIKLDTLRVELLGKLEMFRDQGEAIHGIGESFMGMRQRDQAAIYYQRARKIGEQHGFFHVEGRSCMGLGSICIKAGRIEEGLDLYRNALAASGLSEKEDNNDTVVVLSQLTNTLVATGGWDELEALIPRFRESSLKETKRLGRLCLEELSCLHVTAQLLEARGRPQEALKELHALLDLARNNQAPLQRSSYIELVREVSLLLKSLDPKTGEEERTSAKHELAKRQADFFV